MFYKIGNYKIRDSKTMYVASDFNDVMKIRDFKTMCVASDFNGAKRLEISRLCSVYRCNIYY